MDLRNASVLPESEPFGADAGRLPGRFAGEYLG